MIVITNNPSLSEAFRNEEIRDFFKEFLIELENPYVLKSFLTKGAEVFYNEQIEQLSKSFVAIKLSRTEKNVYFQVMRCIDGEKFKVGDKVYDLISRERRRGTIGRLYDDDRGLHVKFEVDGDKEGTFSWRDLSTISHTLPEVKKQDEED